MKYKSMNKLFTLIIHYKLFNVPYYEILSYYIYPFCK
jgi:hypothetical protein